MTTTSRERADQHPREKHAPDDVPVEDTIRKRWSPRSFSERKVSEDDLKALLEAARWAPSSYNEQPWRFIVARRENEEGFEAMLGCLNANNRKWAAEAPVLMLTATKRRFSKTGEENRHAFHDVGLAMGNLLNQATAMGLYVHQMAGIHPERAREVYDVPEEYEIVAGVALGYLGDPDELEDEGLQDAETRERSRKPLEELVFEGAWGRTADFVEEG